MLTVTFDGVEYTKATQVAKKFGYTSDYLGQLCRAKKVNARLVGRSWFINVPSLEAHREKKYKKGRESSMGEKEALGGKKATASAEQSSDAQNIDVHKKSDIPNKNYLRRVPSPQAPKRKVAERIDADGVVRFASLQYEEDDHSLIPKVADRPKVTLLKVDVAESEDLPIKAAEQAESTFEPEPLPEVSLSGSLSVSSIPDDSETQEEKDVSTTMTSEVPVKKKSSKRDKHKNKLEIVEVEALESEKNVLAEPEEEVIASAINASDPEKYPVPIRVVVSKDEKLSNSSQQYDPISSELSESVAVEIPVDADSPVQSVAIDYRLPVLGAVSGVLVSVALLSLEQVSVVSSEMVDFTLNFDLKNISNFALVLFTG